MKTPIYVTKINNPMLTYLFTLVALLVPALLLVLWIIWPHAEENVHKRATIDYCQSWDYGTFDQFMREFNKCNWEPVDRLRPDSFFEYFPDKAFTTKSRIHSSVIQFDRKGMVLRGRDFKKFIKFIESKVRLANGRTPGLWDQS